NFSNGYDEKAEKVLEKLKNEFKATLIIDLKSSDIPISVHICITTTFTSSFKIKSYKLFMNAIKFPNKRYNYEIEKKYSIRTMKYNHYIY
ncbi:hypothetical protein PIROE2DRAFT_6168, partial [Piromyces sp. E2]